MTVEEQALITALRDRKPAGRFLVGTPWDGEEYVTVPKRILDGLADITDYAAHASWRCDYRKRYGECHCGLDDLCDRLGIERVPPNDPEAAK
jgi:hypothetical protein